MAEFMTSLNQEGVEGDRLGRGLDTHCTLPILVMSVSLLGTHSFFLIKEA
jgi:hypothetical protein